MYMSEFSCYVMLNFWRRSPAIYLWIPKKLGTCDWPSRNWNRRSLWVAAPKSSVHVEYEKLLENYLCAQGTFNPMLKPDKIPVRRCVILYWHIARWIDRYAYIHEYRHTAYIWMYLSIYLSIYIYISISISISIYKYIYIYISVYIYLYLYLSIYLSIYIFLSV